MQTARVIRKVQTCEWAGQIAFAMPKSHAPSPAAVPISVAARVLLIDGFMLAMLHSRSRLVGFFFRSGHYASGWWMEFRPRPAIHQAPELLFRFTKFVPESVLLGFIELLQLQVVQQVLGRSPHSVVDNQERVIFAGTFH